MRRTAVLAITAAALCMLLAAPAANAGFFGLNYSFNRLDNSDVGKLNKSGAKAVRWTFVWPRIEHSQGNFDWSIPDKLVGDLASRGIRVLPVIWGSPSWVASEARVPPVRSSKARNAWKGFLRAAVKRYGPGGSYWTVHYRLDHPGKKALPIKAWQIWNEPNLQSAMKPPKPGTYARLLKLSHSALKAAGPKAKLMLAGMPGYSGNGDAWDFLRQLYRKKAGNAFDIASLHPYARNVKQMKSEVKRFRHTMRKHGDGHKPLWVTEIGWGSLPPGATPYGQTKGKKGQARILKHAFHALKKQRHHWHVKKVLWFNFRDPAGGSVEHCSFCSSAGLLKHDGHAKPAWNAFRNFTR